MIALLDISDALKAMLKTLEPESEVYQHFKPDNFVRPSFLVDLGKVQVVEMNKPYLGFSLKVTLVGFETVDPYHHSQIDTLIQRMASVLALFYDGYFPVGDRNPHVEALAGDLGLDYFEVDLTVEWSEELLDENTLPLMRDLYLKVEDKGGL